MQLTLYVVHGSHPCAAVIRALELKGLSHRVVELPPGAHAAYMRVRFGVRTVPGLVIDRRERISGSRAIMRRLERLAPEPPLIPADPERRARVEEAERWGDEVLQPIAREMIWPALKNSPRSAPGFSAHSRLPLPGPALVASIPLIAQLELRLNRTDDGLAMRRLRELPEHLDHIDALIGDGVIGDAAQPNVADLQIASTVRLLGVMADVRPALDGRPCDALARELFPVWDGDLPVGSIAAEPSAA